MKTSRQSSPPPVDRYVLLVLALSEALALGSVVLTHFPRLPRAVPLSEGMAVLSFMVLGYYLFLRLAVRSQGWAWWGRRPRR